MRKSQTGPVRPKLLTRRVSCTPTGAAARHWIGCGREASRHVRRWQKDRTARARRGRKREQLRQTGASQASALPPCPAPRRRLAPPVPPDDSQLFRPSVCSVRRRVAARVRQPQRHSIAPRRRRSAATQVRLDVVFAGWRSRARLNKPVRDELRLRKQVLDCLMKPFAERTASDVVRPAPAGQRRSAPAGLRHSDSSELSRPAQSQAIFMGFISRATALNDLKKEVRSTVP